MKKFLMIAIMALASTAMFAQKGATYVGANVNYGLHSNYKNLVNGLTPQKVASFVKDVILKAGNQVEVVMLPDMSEK